jgi:hypothetical protein
LIVEQRGILRLCSQGADRHLFSARVYIFVVSVFPPKAKNMWGALRVAQRTSSSLFAAVAEFPGVFARACTSSSSLTVEVRAVSCHIHKILHQ